MESHKLRSVLCTASLLLILGLTNSSLAAGKGGNKPPPSTPPANPVIVYSIGADLVVADKDGSNQTVVYHNPSGTTLRASWCSPNGTDIIFQQTLNGQPGIYRLRIVDISSGNRVISVGTPQLVAKTSSSVWYFSATCSPGPINGTIKVAYEADVTDASGNPLDFMNVYIANVTNVEDQNPIEILRGDENEAEPLNFQSLSWSPSGDRLAFSSTPAGVDGNSDVEVLSLDWSNSNLVVTNRQSLIRTLGTASPLHLRPPDGQDFFWPRWSNTSELIAVDAGTSHLEGRPGGRQLWLIPADSPGSAYGLAYNTVVDVLRMQPSWSPNDSQIMYRYSAVNICGVRKKNPFGIALSYVNDGSTIIPIDGSNCDEAAITTNGGLFPDWWRGAQMP